MGTDFYRVLFDHSSDAHFIMNAAKVVDCNQAAVDLLNCSHKEAVLHLHPAQLSPERQPNGEFSHLAAQKHDAQVKEHGWHRFEWTHRKMTGELFPVEVTLNLVMIHEERYTLAVWHDLTERKRREDEINASHHALQVAHGRMLHDMEAAAVVQQTLLPPRDWSCPGLQTAWTYQPSAKLGGDLLNIFPINSDQVGFYILDVTGHDVAAALLAVTASHLLAPGSHSSLIKESDGSPRKPSQVLRRLNEEFISQDTRAQFLTICYGVINIVELQVNYACAGHPGPIHVPRTGPIQNYDPAGFVIGMLPEVTYEDNFLQLEKGDRLYLCSDGIPEAKNKAGEFYTLEKLIQRLNIEKETSLILSTQTILESVKDWCSPLQAQDDISLLGFELIK